MWVTDYSPGCLILGNCSLSTKILEEKKCHNWDITLTDIVAHSDTASDHPPVQLLNQFSVRQIPLELSSQPNIPKNMQVLNVAKTNYFFHNFWWLQIGSCWCCDIHTFGSKVFVFVPKSQVEAKTKRTLSVGPVETARNCSPENQS